MNVARRWDGCKAYWHRRWLRRSMGRNIIHHFKGQTTKESLWCWVIRSRLGLRVRVVLGLATRMKSLTIARGCCELRSLMTLNLAGKGFDLFTSCKAFAARRSFQLHRTQTFTSSHRLRYYYYLLLEWIGNNDSAKQQHKRYRQASLHATPGSTSRRPGSPKTFRRRRATTIPCHRLSQRFYSCVQTPSTQR